MNKTDNKGIELLDNQVRVKMFGAVEIQNNRGTVIENRSRSSLPWLLIKYLLLNSKREVSQEEIIETLFSYNESTNEDGRARVNLRRAREALKPIGLDGTKGLIMFFDGHYRINYDLELITDEDIFVDLMNRIRKTTEDEPIGLNMCINALEICRGRFMRYTEDFYWLRDHRRYFGSEFCGLAITTLERMRTLDDDSAISLLCRSAVEMVPEEEIVHREIIRFLSDTRQERALMNYMAQLSHYNSTGPRWLRDMEDRNR